MKYYFNVEIDIADAYANQYTEDSLRRETEERLQDLLAELPDYTKMKIEIDEPHMAYDRYLERVRLSWAQDKA